MAEKTLDFLILATQRSGSHMLASALNSHPDISCQGEIARKDEVIEASEGNVTGAILMYNNWRAFGRRFEAGKIIHLVRDAKSTSWSRLANSIDKKLEKQDHRAHFREKVERSFEINAKRAREVEAAISAEVNRMRAKLKETGIRRMEVKYEELTCGGLSVSRIDPIVSRCLTSFLGVDPAELSTDLVKPDTTYILVEPEE